HAPSQRRLKSLVRGEKSLYPPQPRGARTPCPRKEAEVCSPRRRADGNHTVGNRLVLHDASKATIWHRAAVVDGAGVYSTGIVDACEAGLNGEVGRIPSRIERPLIAGEDEDLPSRRHRGPGKFHCPGLSRTRCARSVEDRARLEIARLGRG